MFLWVLKAIRPFKVESSFSEQRAKMSKYFQMKND